MLHIQEIKRPKVGWDFCTNTLESHIDADGIEFRVHFDSMLDVDFLEIGNTEYCPDDDGLYRLYLMYKGHMYTAYELLSLAIVDAEALYEGELNHG